MKSVKIPFDKTHTFSGFFLDYIQQQPSLNGFYGRFPLLENFEGQIKEKERSFPLGHRDILVQSLTEQYKGLALDDAVKKNLASLSGPKTFTVTTGHQLNLFTGPLYFIFKLVTVINACKRLKQAYPAYHFVPVYWMASEDHDFEEIRYFILNRKKYIWQTESKGAVGRIPTASLKKLLDEVPGDIALFKEAYTQGATLREAVRRYVNALFGTEGLLVVDGDDRNLKSLFKEVVREDVFHQTVKKIVDPTTQALEKAGYKTQVHCRDINFFYLEDGLRERIEKKDGYHVVDTSLSFTQKEMEALVESHPERFSPNVVLRPLYQEMILPNLAYTGGPAEVTYWLQLKPVFDHFNIPFPILLPRNFAMVVDKTLYRNFLKTGISFEDLFLDKHSLFKKWVLAHSSHSLSVANEQDILMKSFGSLRERALGIDATLAPMVGAEQKKLEKSLDKIAQKMLRAEKRVHREKQIQLDGLKDALFPSGNLQERTDNFLNFAQQDPHFVRHVLNHFDPFDLQFQVLYYD